MTQSNCITSDYPYLLLEAPCNLWFVVGLVCYCKAALTTRIDLRKLMWLVSIEYNVDCCALFTRTVYGWMVERVRSLLTFGMPVSHFDHRNSFACINKRLCDV